MSRASVVALVLLAILATWLAAPRMEGSSIMTLLHGACASPPLPRACFPGRGGAQAWRGAQEAARRDAEDR